MASCPNNTFAAVVQSLSRIWLCDPMGCSMPGLPVLHCLLDFAQTHAIESVMLSNHLILCSPLLLSPSLFPSMRVFFQGVGSSHQHTLLRLSTNTIVLELHNRISGWVSLFSFDRDQKLLSPHPPTPGGLPSSKVQSTQFADHLPPLAILKVGIVNSQA